MTKGQELTATLRKSFRISTRSRITGDGLDLRVEMLDAIRNAVYYPGYYGAEKTAIYSEAIGAVQSYEKHVDGYRIDGVVRYQIESMSPWQFAGFIGEMVDAGVTNCGQGELFFNGKRASAQAWLAAKQAA